MPDANQLLHKTLGPTPECLPLETLAEGDRDPRARAHLAACVFCRNELALFRSFDSASPADRLEAAAMSSIAASARACVVRETSSRRDRKSIWEALTAWIPAGMPRWIPATAAACLALLIGSGIYFSSADRPSGLPQNSGEGVWRSATVRVLRPLGEVPTRPKDLAWQSVAGAERYRVRLLEVDRTEVWSAETASTAISIPRAVLEQLKPGRSFLWDVKAIGPAGPLTESALHSFHSSVNTR
jgi:hypothetical protein